MKSTAELLEEIDIPRQRLYYLEQKGYIKPRKNLRGEKEFREYSDKDIRKIQVIWKYLKIGFRYRVAYKKAMEELKNSQLKLIE